MALTNEQLKLLAQAAKLLNRDIAGLGGSPDVFVPAAMTWRDLENIIADAQVEGELRRNIGDADDLFNEAAEAFADFHEAASDVEVNPPSDAEVEHFKDKLRALHAHVQAGQRLETAATFAGALAGLIESSVA